MTAKNRTAQSDAEHKERIVSNIMALAAFMSAPELMAFRAWLISEPPQSDQQLLDALKAARAEATAAQKPAV